MQERNIDWLLSAHTATSYQTHNAGVYSDQELNLPPFALQDNAQPTEPQGSALYTCFCCSIFFQLFWAYLVVGLLSRTIIVLKYLCNCHSVFHMSSMILHSHLNALGLYCFHKISKTGHLNKLQPV